MLLKQVITVLLILVVIFGIILIIPDLLYSQPGLPSNPEQTPIDGGLGILAALGGAYAIKKLRNKE